MRVRVSARFRARVRVRCWWRRAYLGVVRPKHEQDDGGRKLERPFKLGGLVVGRCAHDAPAAVAEVSHVPAGAHQPLQLHREVAAVGDLARSEAVR